MMNDDTTAHEAAMAAQLLLDAADRELETAALLDTGSPHHALLVKRARRLHEVAASARHLAQSLNTGWL